MLHIQDLDFVLESIYHLMACLVKLELKVICRTEIECRQTSEDGLQQEKNPNEKLL